MLDEMLDAFAPAFTAQKTIDRPIIYSFFT